jgi:hypothetical protein
MKISQLWASGCSASSSFSRGAAAGQDLSRWFSRRPLIELNLRDVLGAKPAAVFQYLLPLALRPGDSAATLAGLRRGSALQ